MYVHVPMSRIEVSIVQRGETVGVLPLWVDLEIADWIRSGLSVREAFERLQWGDFYRDLNLTDTVERCIERYLRSVPVKSYRLERDEAEASADLFQRYGVTGLTPGEYRAPTLFVDAWTRCATGQGMTESRSVPWGWLLIAGLGAWTAYEVLRR